MYVKRLEGIYGELTVPSIGLTVGTLISWRLVRREESASGETGDWTLHAVFSYINAFAFNEPSLNKQFIVSIGKRNHGAKYKITWNETAKVTLVGRGLQVEGAQIWPVVD